MPTSEKDGTASAIVLYDDEIGDTVDIINKSTVIGDIDLGSYGKESSVSIESGSKVVGNIPGADLVILDINNTDNKNAALWQDIEDSTTDTELQIEFEKGMTGEFALCTRKSDETDWDILDYSGNGINLDFDGDLNSDLWVDLNSVAVDDGVFSYRIVEKNNTLSLAVDVLP